MRATRVVVSGVGVVSPLALNSKQHFDAWLAGESAVVLASDPHFDSYSAQLEARVSGFERKRAITNRMLRKLLSRSAGFSVCAAGEALRDAGVIDDRSVLQRCGLYVGSLSLEIDPEVFIPPLKASLTGDGQFDISLFARRGMKLLDPLFLLRALPNAGVCGISVEHQVLGPNTNLTNGATSGLSSVGLAMRAIQRGEVGSALAGGYDTLLVMDSIAEHLIANRLSRSTGVPAAACRPFDRQRDGYALGEGAAFVFLEAEDRARARDAKVYAELLSTAATTDVALLRPERATDGTALTVAARQAVEHAGCTVDELGAIFGDGLGTQQDDVREAGAVKALVSLTPVPFTAATPALGYTGAASGVFSLVHAVLALDRAIVPPLANCHDPDPRCDIRYLTRPQPMTAERVLVWNSERGIKNVALVAGSGPR